MHRFTLASCQIGTKYNNFLYYLVQKSNVGGCWGHFIYGKKVKRKKKKEEEGGMR